ncbi:MAG: bifunctional diaminohydroxyphosphoribosylaminopyrimidine deaminase/5-amino-6-(5-phosphoribosylamino)uracil reductase RibD [Candidatus Omnitrophica bacterium]|nr:bifunctional diaminohydroxyphosphoribosylaminopyrimidine deaminase/5-amino-6-(5-phosphoribosylamino)uracil reductase RibD [Candidatus Omnitrophota bacterium]
MSNAKYMDMAIRLAKKGGGYVNPNPMVGAVIVKNGEIIGKGYHCKFGGPHAEINALAKAGTKAKGATMYVSLEPCSCFGKTPPCTRAIIKAGIKKVVIAAIDPNPLNKGKGIKELKRNGIKVELGLAGKKAQELNEKFFVYHKKKRPFISVKCAMTMDGKIATVTGASKWITSKKARNYGHLLRHEHDAIMAGINTIKADNPELTARLSCAMRKPVIVIVDSCLSIPLQANVLKNAKKNTVIIATTKMASLKKKKLLSSRGVEILTVASKNGRVCLSEVVKKLAKKRITSVLVEGGGEIIYSLLNERLADKIYFFYAPKILGGRKAPTPVGGEGIKDINKAVKIKDISCSKIGKDILIAGYPVYG